MVYRSTQHELRRRYLYIELLRIDARDSRFDDECVLGPAHFESRPPDGLALRFYPVFNGVSNSSTACSKDLLGTLRDVSLHDACIETGTHEVDGCSRVIYASGERGSAW